MQKKLNILFLCTGNSCRSQMAEGWARELLGEKVNAYSAGIEIHGLNPNAVKVMEESGVDISNQKSESIKEYVDKKLDYVITVCGHAHETCPIFPGESTVVHQSLPDPPQMAKQLAADGASEEVQLDCYREVRDLIKAYVLTLPQVLLGHE